MKQKEPIQWEQMTQVRARALIHYAIPHPRPQRQYTQFTKPTYSGQMTMHAARRIRKTIDLFFQLSPERTVWNDVSSNFQKFRVNFITLTISCQQLVPCKEAYERLLAPFLRKLRTLGKISYVWKGEFQKRGQPHYHITTNAFINWTTVREWWNNLQEKAGYLAEYRAAHGHSNAPSTEVKAVRKLEKVDLYLAKYLAKNDPTKKWEGKVWGCSENLRTGRQFAFSNNFEDDIYCNQKIDEGIGKRTYLDRISITEAASPSTLLTSERRTELAEHLRLTQ